MEGWRTVKLGEVADLNGGYAFKSSQYTDAGRFVLRTVNIGEDFSITREGATFISERDALQYSRFELQDKDTLFVMVAATLGKVGYVRREILPALLNQNMWVIRAKPGLIDPDFLQFSFRELSKIPLAWVSGSARSFLRRDDVRNLEFSLPPFPEQRGIASILGALDDKIELNRRMNETLEAMARAIFKDWFVDFGPTRAKMEGRAPYLAPDIWSLFPDRLDEEGKPEGWRTDQLGQLLAVLETGGRPKGGVSRYTGGVPSVGAESITGLGKFDFGKTKFVPEEFFVSMNKGHVQSRDVLLYKDGGRPGLFEPHVTLFGDGFPFSRFAINEHVYRMRAVDSFGQNCLYFWLTTDLIEAEMRTKGTGVAIPGLNSTQVRSLSVVVPSGGIAKRLDDILEPFITRILANCNESKTLAAIRDYLLPKLMSGEIRLKDGEKVVGNVV